MFIERLRIDRFGILHEQEAPALSPGVSVFLGHNEAGKSTCLNFLRAMLFGYKRSGRTLDPMPEKRGKTLGGGSLFLNTRSLGGLILTRRPGVHGGELALSTAAGESLDETDLQRLFSGMTVEVFDNIFAIGLRNLMELSTLKGDSVRHALHAAAFGTGLRSPAKVLKTLEDRMGELLLSRDFSGAAMNTALRELAETQEALRSRGSDMEEYRRTVSGLDRAGARLEELAEEQRLARAAARKVRRRLSVWEQWEEARRLRAESAALEETRPPDEDRAPFAPDALQRLETLLRQKEDRLLALKDEELALELLESEMSALEVAPHLADLLGRAQALREQKDRRRKEMQSLPALRAEIRSLSARQDEVLARLGNAWTAGEAAGADVSLFVRDDLRQGAGRLRECEERLRLARREEARLARDAEQAAARLGEAREALAVLPPLPGPPPAAEDGGPDSPAPLSGAFPPDHKPAPGTPDLPPQTDDAFMEALAALASHDPRDPRARGIPPALPGLVRRQREAAARARRALADVSPSWTAASLARFDASPRARQRALESASLARQARSKSEESLRRLAAAEESLAALLGKTAAAEARLAAAYARLPGEEELERRHAVLRQLERASIELEEAEITLEAADSALDDLLADRRGKARGARERRAAVWLCAGLCALLAGLGLTVFFAVRDMPVLSLSGMGLMMAGAAAALLPRHLAAGPQSGDDVPPALARARAKAGERAEKLAALVGLLARETASWFAFENPAAPSAPELERARQRLEREWRLLAVLRREEEDLAAPRAEAEAARLRRDALGAESGGFAAEAADALAAWQKLLHGLDLPPETAPEAAAGIFERVETARALAETAAQAADAAFRELLGRHRDAEAAVEARAAALLGLSEESARAAAEARAAIDALTAEQSRWSEWLSARRLSPSLSPQAAAEALECLLDIRSRQETLVRHISEAEATEAGLTDFARRVALLSREAGLPPPPAVRFNDKGEVIFDRPIADIAPEIPPLLDTLARRAEDAARALGLHAEKAGQRARRIQSLERARTALTVTEEALEALLAGSDAESFRAAFARRQRLEDLSARERALLSGIESLAAEEGADLETVLDELRRSSLDELREERDRLDGRCAALDDEQRLLDEERGRLLERQNALRGGEGGAPLRAREAALRDTLHDLSRRWMVPALARELLLTAKARFEEEGRQGVMRFAGDIFASITGGEYTGVAASLEGESFAALHKSGERRDPERQLSQGAREQMYLALRLAYVKNHAAKAEPLPLVMDDILVNFDPQRAARAAETLADFAVENQILFFTCHPATANLLLDAARRIQGPPPALFAIQRGEFTVEGAEG